jgi:hypothetical protein
MKFPIETAFFMVLTLPDKKYLQPSFDLLLFFLMNSLLERSRGNLGNGLKRKEYG